MRALDLAQHQIGRDGCSLEAIAVPIKAVPWVIAPTRQRSLSHRRRTALWSGRQSSDYFHPRDLAIHDDGLDPFALHRPRGSGENTVEGDGVVGDLVVGAFHREAAFQTSWAFRISALPS